MDSITMSRLNSLSAVDGRYGAKTEALSPFLSEAGLIRYRIKVEALWLLHLIEDPTIGRDVAADDASIGKLRDLAATVTPEMIAKVKDYEQTTNHDVKAVEYFMRDELRDLGAADSVLAFIHFACTSEDINNIAYALMLQEARDKVLGVQLQDLVGSLQQHAQSYSDVAMLARTHGQTASPTTLGKEFAVFGHRLAKQTRKLQSLRLEAKMNGAVGNYNAHITAYPHVDWPETARCFIEERLGLVQNVLTTQIENHDSMIEFCDILRRIHNISIGLCRDLWTYISLGYFTQQTKAGEVGSSTMPHKVNPIDFENAEGNFGLANGLLSHLSDKLLISRLQRDLTDSTVQRAFGTVFGHSLIAMQSLAKGLAKIAMNDAKIAADLEGAWEVLAEPVQTVMRKHGVVDAYERLKAATRGQSVTKETLQQLISESEEIPSSEQQLLLQLTPNRYIGLAKELSLRFVEGRSV